MDTLEETGPVIIGVEISSGFWQFENDPPGYNKTRIIQTRKRNNGRYIQKEGKKKEEKRHGTESEIGKGQKTSGSACFLCFLFVFFIRYFVCFFIRTKVWKCLYLAHKFRLLNTND